jgi:Variant SH3 domain
MGCPISRIQISVSDRMLKINGNLKNLIISDEFSDEDDEHTATKKEVNGHQSQSQVPAESPVPLPTVIGRCKALYSYTPKLYDELELEPGDIIEIHTKQEDGWWLGKLNNNIGIFPATYVEELQ